MSREAPMPPKSPKYDVISNGYNLLILKAEEKTEMSWKPLQIQDVKWLETDQCVEILLSALNNGLILKKEDLISKKKEDLISDAQHIISYMLAPPAENATNILTVIIKHLYEKGYGQDSQDEKLYPVRYNSQPVINFVTKLINIDRRNEPQTYEVTTKGNKICVSQIEAPYKTDYKALTPQDLVSLTIQDYADIVSSAFQKDLISNNSNIIFDILNKYDETNIFSVIIKRLYDNHFRTQDFASLTIQDYADIVSSAFQKGLISNNPNIIFDILNKHDETNIFSVIIKRLYDNHFRTQDFASLTIEDYADIVSSAFQKGLISNNPGIICDILKNPYATNIFSVMIKCLYDNHFRTTFRVDENYEIPILPRFVEIFLKDIREMESSTIRCKFTDDHEYISNMRTEIHRNRNWVTYYQGEISQRNAKIPILGTFCIRYNITAMKVGEDYEIYDLHEPKIAPMPGNNVTEIDIPSLKAIVLQAYKKGYITNNIDDICNIITNPVKNTLGTVIATLYNNQFGRGDRTTSMPVDKRNIEKLLKQSGITPDITSRNLKPNSFEKLMDRLTTPAAKTELIKPPSSLGTTDSKPDRIFQPIRESWEARQKKYKQQEYGYRARALTAPMTPPPSI